MFLGVVGFAAVVLFVLALSARSSPVPAGVEGAVAPVRDLRPARLPPSRSQATLTLAGLSLAIWSLYGTLSLRMPADTPDLAAAKAANVRGIHIIFVLAVALVLPTYLLTVSGSIMGYRANRGRARARGFFGPDAVLGGAYRSLGLSASVKVFAAVSLYALAVLFLVHHIVS
jgi:hypothetical protein